MKLQLNKHNRKGFTLIELMVVIAILAALAAVGYGPIMDHMGDGDRQAARSNLGNIHKVLIAFKQDHSSFPCDETANKLQGGKKGKGDKTEYNFGELTGDYSNCYFRQLFYKHTQDEKQFYAKIKGFTEGDNSIAQGKCLQPGENSFSYVLKKGDGKKFDRTSVSDLASNTPIVFSCVTATDKPYSGDEVKFNMGDFRYHAFMLTVDGSVTDLIDKPGWEDDSEDTSKPAKSVFPENKKTGASTGDKYLVLTPEESNE